MRRLKLAPAKPEQRELMLYSPNTLETDRVFVQVGLYDNHWRVGCLMVSLVYKVLNITTTEYYESEH